MSGRLGQLWLRYNGLEAWKKGAETLYYVVASSKNHYHVLNLDTGEFVSFKKKKLDSRPEQPTWFTEAQSWQPYWKRIA